MRILAIELDIEVRELYKNWLSKERHRVEAMANITYDFDASDYDVVIVHSDEVKHHLINVRYDRVIVASSKPTARMDGSWALSKPFHMEELWEIMDVIEGGNQCKWEGVTLQ